MEKRFEVQQCGLPLTRWAKNALIVEVAEYLLAS